MRPSHGPATTWPALGNPGGPSNPGSVSSAVGAAALAPNGSFGTGLRGPARRAWRGPFAGPLAFEGLAQAEKPVSEKASAPVVGTAVSPATLQDPGLAL